MEVANQKRHEISGHFGGSGEVSVCLPGMGPGVSVSMGLLEMAVSPVSTTRVDIVGGFEGRLVEARKGAAGVGGFELSDGVIACRGFGEIEAAQLVVEDAGVGDGQRCLAGGKLRGKGKGGLLLVRVKGDGGGLLLAAGGDSDGLKGDFGGIEGDAAGWLGQGYVDGFYAGEGGGLEIGCERELVMLGDHGGGKPLGVCVVENDADNRRSGNGSAKRWGGIMKSS